MCYDMGRYLLLTFFKAKHAAFSVSPLGIIKRQPTDFCGSEFDSEGAIVVIDDVVGDRTM